VLDEKHRWEIAHPLRRCFGIAGRNALKLEARGSWCSAPPRRGRRSRMDDYGEIMTARELIDLVAFLRSLR
jgi:hypothetical protein